MSKDSTLNWALKNNRLQDTRVVDKEWRKDKLPKIDIEVRIGKNHVLLK